MPVANVSVASAAATVSAVVAGVEHVEPAGAVLLLGALAQADAPGVDLGVVVAVDEVDGLEVGHAADVCGGAATGRSRLGPDL